jgi:uncharacterized membrane protein
MLTPSYDDNPRHAACHKISDQYRNCTISLFYILGIGLKMVTKRQKKHVADLFNNKIVFWLEILCLIGFVVSFVSFTLYSRSATVCNLHSCISFLWYLARNGMQESQWRAAQTAVLTRREHRRTFWNNSHRLLEGAEQNYETFRGLVLNVGPPECEAIMPSTAAQHIKCD